jgi:hypothetical protein
MSIRSRSFPIIVAVGTLVACAQPPTEAPEPERDGRVGTAEQAVATPSLSMKVTNTDAEAVPTKATGTTTVAGTIAASQSGAWNVGISGTPAVAAQQSGGWDVNVAGDVSLAPGSTVVAQQDPNASWNVNVTNTPTVGLLPGATVGVTGAVNVANTPTVHVASMPPINVGPVTLSGSSTVEVTNDASNPAFVRNADEPGLRPFQKKLFIFLPANDNSESQSATIPAGKRLVVRSVSATMSPSSPNAYVDVWAYGSAGQEDFGELLVPLTELGGIAGTSQGLLYAVEWIKVGCTRTGGNSYANCDVTVTGYLVDL